MPSNSLPSLIQLTVRAMFYENSFFVRIALLGGTRKLAVQNRTISFSAFRPPCTSSQNSEFIQSF